MDDSRFDAWTRRRFGLAAGGAAVSLFGRGGNQDVGARKKRKKKKRPAQDTCAALGQPCDPGNRACCGNAACEVFDGVAKCCIGGNDPCASSAECCNRICFEGACVIR